MDDNDILSLEAETFDDLFNLDVRVEATGRPMGRCNPTDDGCSNSCPSVGCSATCKNCG